MAEPLVKPSVSRVKGLGVVNMFSNDGRPESGNWELPRSSWAIPAFTGLVILLALAVALA
jgi:hypothetical protein